MKAIFSFIFRCSGTTGLLSAFHTAPKFDTNCLLLILQKSKGSVIHERDDNGNTPLYNAVANVNQYVVMDVLLGYSSIDVNATNCKGETALIIGCMKRSRYVYKLIQHSSVDVNMKDEEGINHHHNNHI